jgi:hypothetical protein
MLLIILYFWRFEGSIPRSIAGVKGMAQEVSGYSCTNGQRANFIFVHHVSIKGLKHLQIRDVTRES